MGVVWCKCWTTSEAPPAVGNGWAVKRSLGGGGGGDGMGRFLVTNLSWKAAVVPLVHPREESFVYGYWVDNHKWLVVAVNPYWETLTEVVVWKIDEVTPSVRAVGICLKFPVPVAVTGATFSPFNPGGDELVVMGASFEGDGSGCHLYYVDLKKSVESGTTAVVTHALALPEPASDLLWAAPDTILTMGSISCGIKVYNTKTREQEGVFPYSTYQNLECIPPAHFSLMVRDPQRSTVREVYSTSDTRHPLCKIERRELDTDWCVHSTDPGIYALLQRCPACSEGQHRTQLQLSVHDAITGQSIAIVTLTPM
ncbi:hypothetical protein Pelo_18379 [Pelomyxa schiedti]|nr:hypothetical protein Pelo_18379 [Pelomyxa schiedti]